MKFAAQSCQVAVEFRLMTMAPAYLRPSVNTETFYIHATRRAGSYPRKTEDSGKWLIFVPVLAVDEVWGRIRQATENGDLGGASKVATAKPNALTLHNNKRVICIYTYDCRDEADVMRVRAELRKLGINESISYKPDKATRAWAYSRDGTRVGKYRA